MEESASRTFARTENRPIIQAIVARRASLGHLMLSRSAPDALTLGQLTPFRSASGTSLPASPSCSVGTQTPTDSTHFEFPDPTLEIITGDAMTIDYRGVNRRMVLPAGRHYVDGRNESRFSGVQGVGQQLRSIGDDFERSRLTRSRSLSFIQLFTQGRRRGSIP